MESHKRSIIKLTIKQNGSIKSFVKNTLGTEIATISSKNGRFNKIERRKNNKNETIEVRHSAWGSDFYHEDVKYAKFPDEQKIDEAYCKKELQKKKQLRKIINEVKAK